MQSAYYGIVHLKQLPQSHVCSVLWLCSWKLGPQIQVCCCVPGREEMSVSYSCAAVNTNLTDIARHMVSL